MKSYNVYITNLLNYQNLMFTLNNHHSASGKLENHDESDFIVSCLSWPVLICTGPLTQRQNTMQANSHNTNVMQ